MKVYGSCIFCRKRLVLEFDHNRECFICSTCKKPIPFVILESRRLSPSFCYFFEKPIVELLELLKLAEYMLPQYISFLSGQKVLDFMKIDYAKPHDFDYFVESQQKQEKFLREYSDKVVLEVIDIQGIGWFFVLESWRAMVEVLKSLRTLEALMKISK